MDIFTAPTKLFLVAAVKQCYTLTVLRCILQARKIKSRGRAIKTENYFMNLPNKLTLIRILLIPAFLAVLLGGFLPYANYAAAGIFVLASLTDWLDGYIARRFNLVTNFGKFADPLADKLLVAAALIAFVELSAIDAWIVILLISREFFVTGLRLLAAEKGTVMAADFWGKLKTAVQMVMIIFILLGFTFAWADIVKDVLVAACVLLSVYSAFDYTVKNKRVFR